VLDCRVGNSMCRALLTYTQPYHVLFIPTASLIINSLFPEKLPMIMPRQYLLDRLQSGYFKNNRMEIFSCTNSHSMHLLFLSLTHSFKGTLYLGSRCLICNWGRNNVSNTPCGVQKSNIFSYTWLTPI